MTKMQNGKIKSTNNIALPDERRPYFTKAARKKIPQSTIDHIKEKNWMDVQLYEYAVQLYDAYLKEQKEQGLLPEIPKVDTNETEAAPGPPLFLNKFEGVCSRSTKANDLS